MQIIALGVSYFVAVSALDVTSNVGTIDDLTSLARMLLVLPVAALDAVFILWVFTSLSRTLNQLQARKATAKLELYRQAVSPDPADCQACWPVCVDCCLQRCPASTGPLSMLHLMLWLVRSARCVLLAGTRCR